MTTAQIFHLNRARLAKARQNKLEQHQKNQNRKDGRNVLVYRGVPYVRLNAQ
jgi:hypothetical protein|tara:strand:+ start:1687 stop:1842 length:156 start_codon:yes stop_codon:yes gene_type:complete